MATRKHSTPPIAAVTAILLALAIGALPIATLVVLQQTLPGAEVLQ